MIRKKKSWEYLCLLTLTSENFLLHKHPMNINHFIEINYYSVCIKQILITVILLFYRGKRTISVIYSCTH